MSLLRRLDKATRPAAQEEPQATGRALQVLAGAERGQVWMETWTLDSYYRPGPAADAELVTAEAGQLAAQGLLEHPQINLDAPPHLVPPIGYYRLTSAGADVLMAAKHRRKGARRG